MTRLLCTCIACLALISMLSSGCDSDDAENGLKQSGSSTSSRSVPAQADNDSKLLESRSTTPLQKTRDEGSEPSIAETLYDGISLGTWRQRIKNLDPKSAASREWVPGLFSILKDEQAPDVARQQAALTLGRMGQTAATALPYLIDRLQNSECPQSERLWVMKALAHFGRTAKTATPALIEIYTDADANIRPRLASLEALSRVGSAHSRVIPTLISVLEAGEAENRTDDLQLKSATVDSIALIGPEASSAVPALLRASRTDNENLRRRSIAALGAMKRNAEVAIESLVEFIVFDESDSVRDAAGVALSQVGPAAVESLRHLLTDEDPEVRWRAAQALNQLGPSAQRARDDLIKTLSDDDPNVRMYATEALWSITTDSKHVITIVLAEFENDDRQIRIRAFRLFVEIAPKSIATTARLRKLALDEREFVRSIAKKALDSIK